MKKVNWSRILSHAAVGLICALLTAAVMLGVFAVRQKNDKLYALERLIQNCFIGEVDQTKLEDAAAYGMVAALGDKWSYYIPADQYAAYMEQMNNSYVGVGITIAMLAFKQTMWSPRWLAIPFWAWIPTKASG